jgi:hypothetical protein
MPGDSLVVHDPRLRRVSLFSPEGTYVRGLSVAGVPSGSLSLFGVGPEGVLGIAVSMPTWEDPRAQYTFTGDTLAILIHAAAGLDTLGWRRGTERAIWAAFEGGSVSSVAQTRHPYAHSVLIGATQRTVFVADALGHQVEIRDWAGTLQRLARRLDAPPAVLGSEERARYAASRVAAAEARGASNMAELEQATEELLAVLPQDHTVPPFDRLLTTSEGRLWLRDFVAPASQGSEQRWVVYDAEGRVVRMVAVPAEVTVMHVSEEHVTGVMRDSLGVEYVVVHRIERGS